MRTQGTCEATEEVGLAPLRAGVPVVGQADDDLPCGPVALLGLERRVGEDALAQRQRVVGVGGSGTAGPCPVVAEHELLAGRAAGTAAGWSATPGRRAARSSTAGPGGAGTGRSSPWVGPPPAWPVRPRAPIRRAESTLARVSRLGRLRARAATSGSEYPRLSRSLVRAVPRKVSRTLRRPGPLLGWSALPASVLGEGLADGLASGCSSSCSSCSSPCSSRSSPGTTAGCRCRSRRGRRGRRGRPAR